MLKCLECGNELVDNVCIDCETKKDLQRKEKNLTHFQNQQIPTESYNPPTIKDYRSVCEEEEKDLFKERCK